MVSRREWYRRTEATWPDAMPLPTPEEALRGAKKLYRFVRGHKFGGPVVLTSGRRFTCIRNGVMHVNPDHPYDRGWKGIVHHLSHDLGGGHSKEHARLEASMIREVLKRGWLEGKLRSPEPMYIKPDAAMVLAVKLIRTEQAIKRWESKAKRAATALKKLRRRLKYYERTTKETA